MKTALFMILTLSFFLSGCSGEPKKMPYILTVKETGIGLINKETPFDVHIIESKLLGFNVAKFTFFEAGVPHPIIRVTHNDSELFLIYPTDDLQHIQSISIQNRAVANADATIGSDFKTLSQQPFQCTDTQAAQFTCKLRTGNTLEYLFIDNILKEIRWTPSR